MAFLRQTALNPRVGGGTWRDLLLLVLLLVTSNTGTSSIQVTEWLQVTQHAQHDGRQLDGWSLSCLNRVRLISWGPCMRSGCLGSEHTIALQADEFFRVQNKSSWRADCFRCEAARALR
eukprot:6477263-Amphidinium_carterae.2